MDSVERAKTAEQFTKKAYFQRNWYKLLNFYHKNLISALLEIQKLLHDLKLHNFQFSKSLEKRNQVLQKILSSTGNLKSQILAVNKLCKSTALFQRGS